MPQNRPGGPGYPIGMHQLSGELQTIIAGAAVLERHAAEGDLWETHVLGADVTTSSLTPIDACGMCFDAKPRHHWEFVGQIMLRCADPSGQVRIGIGWPANGIDGTAILLAPGTVPGSLVAIGGNHLAPLLSPAGRLGDQVSSWPAWIIGHYLAGDNPTRHLRVQLAAGGGGAPVTAKAGSFLRYRIIP